MMTQYFLSAIFLASVALLPAHDAAATSFFDGFKAAKEQATSTASLKDDTRIAPVLQRAINWLLSLVGVIAVAAIIYAGATLILARGEEAKMEKAKQTLFWAIAGLIFVIFSWVIITVVADQILV